MPGLAKSQVFQLFTRWILFGVATHPGKNLVRARNSAHANVFHLAAALEAVLLAQLTFRAVPPLLDA